MNEEINNKDYKPLTPFKGWVLENFPFIEADFDAITNYQLICKVTEYLNNVIYNQNEVQDLATELVDGYNALLEYVNNYFNNLDLQEEVNIKLDEMAEDGTLTNLIKDYCDPILYTIDTKATNAINNANEAKTSVNTFTETFTGLLNQESSTRATADAALQTSISEIVASAGTAGESSSEIVQARTNTKNITFTALDDRLDYTENVIPFGSQAIQNADLNNLLTPKNYYVYGNLTNVPTLTGISFATNTAYVVVEGYDPIRDNTTGNITRYTSIVQRYYPYYNSANGFRGHFTRLIKWNGSTNSYIYETWNGTMSSFVQAIFQPDNKIYRVALYDYYGSNGVLTSSTDVNTLIKEGSWLLTNASNTPTGLTVGILTNNVAVSSGIPWVTQTFKTANGSEMWYRICQIKPTDPVFNEWKKIYPNSSTIQLTGKKIVNFGDSIFGNTQGANSVSSAIAGVTGATTYNLGFGGCQMSDRSETTWRAFSMCNIAYAIANNDYTLQDNAINDETWSSKPYYFDNTVSVLKSIDYSTVDYATISYGTNDYTTGDALDNPNNPKDINTFAGALRYSIETIQTAFPNIRLIIGSPTFRLWDESGTMVTSDTKTFAGGYNLIQMTEKAREIALEYHLPFVDAYNELGINKFNYSAFFDGTDYTHPNAYGNGLLGRLYGMNILK